MNLPAVPDPEHAETRKLRLRYAGVCTRCGRNLAKGEEALYDASTRTVQCIVCDSAAANGAGPVEAFEDSGVAGASADREYKRRKSARDARVRARLGGLLGGLVLAVSDEPQSTRAWARGATGERKLADALEDVPQRATWRTLSTCSLHAVRLCSCQANPTPSRLHPQADLKKTWELVASCSPVR
jgi:hypothetical protein